MSSSVVIICKANDDDLVNASAEIVFVESMRTEVVDDSTRSDRDKAIGEQFRGSNRNWPGRGIVSPLVTDVALRDNESAGLSL